MVHTSTSSNKSHHERLRDQTSTPACIITHPLWRPYHIVVPKYTFSSHNCLLFRDIYHFLSMSQLCDMFAPKISTHSHRNANPHAKKARLATTPKDTYRFICWTWRHAPTHPSSWWRRSCCFPWQRWSTLQQGTRRRTWRCGKRLHGHRW